MVAGVVGAELSTKALVILGVANLLADGFSMAAANYSGTTAEIEEYEQLRHMEERHVEYAPEGDREEIRQIFKAKGFEGHALESAVDVITAERGHWIKTMMTEEHGLPPVSRSPRQSSRLYLYRLYFVRLRAAPSVYLRLARLDLSLDRHDRTDLFF
ncbi:MAG: VIT1/CCC1 transporter family protein [Methyloceanibacter sp.]|uniref:VIT1/CCC1 transporter family protein n=1 Tax=Methyloceanibacter sp. TaxID=1965321 RepID=UPI003D9B0A80